jgi:protein-S-isoprenylcysteine O-methyltransferase Ste14
MGKDIVRFVAVAFVGVLALAATSLGQMPRIAICAIVGLPSFVLMIMSRRQLGKSFSISPEAKALITAGLYSRIQHPMYLFLDLLLAAIVVAIDWPMLLLAWVTIIVVQVIQSRREEKVLAIAFGAEYEAYTRQTWI